MLSIKRGTLYKTEVSPCTHDLAILLPILYSVSRVNAYLNSQHPYECPTAYAMVFRQGELSGFVIHLGNSGLEMPGPDFCSKLQLKHTPAAKKNIQVIKNIKNVAGCRDTRTAKSKETR